MPIKHTEVERCPVELCALYPYRLGKDPGRKPRRLSDERRKAAVDNLKHARERISPL